MSTTDRYRSPEAFVAAVRDALDRIPEALYQDQLDLLLLGETVPAVPIPFPDPECPDCRGCGAVCDCHGIEWAWARRDHGGKRETCRCVTRGRRG